MGFDELLVHRADVYGLAQAKDRFNQPTNVYEEKILDVPCRLATPKGTKLVTLASLGVVSVTHVVYMRPIEGINIIETDRINVREAGQDGAVLALDLDVVMVARVSSGAGHGHHLELSCAEVKQGV
jgi:hypothetical protein